MSELVAVHINNFLQIIDAHQMCKDDLGWEQEHFALHTQWWDKWLGLAENICKSSV